MDHHSCGRHLALDGILVFGERAVLDPEFRAAFGIGGRGATAANAGKEFFDARIGELAGINPIVALLDVFQLLHECLNLSGRKLERFEPSRGRGVVALQFVGALPFILALDGRLDAVVSTNDGPVYILHNQSSSQNHWLSLKLVGHRSNRDAIGTEIKLVTSKGAAGVAGAAFVVLAGTLASLGTIPVASIAVILGIHRLMSGALTPVNVVGNCLATIGVAKWEGAVDLLQLHEQIGAKSTAIPAAVDAAE